MVQFEDDTITDDQADAMALARAFQAASDNDIRTVLNAMSGQSRSATDPLNFYIVPASWFVKAFPILTARSTTGISDNWREQIGRIANVELINVTGREVSSDDDEIGKAGGVSDVQKKRFESMHRKVVQNRQQSTMKHGLVHKKDYFFLGPSAWMLVKEKFDFDGYELSRPVVSAPNTRNTIAIQLRDEESDGFVSAYIRIPASGRFAYEKVMARLDSNTSLSAIVPDDDDDANEEAPWETPGEQDEVKSDESPILLLPPSTTRQPQSNEYSMDTDQRNDEHTTNAHSVFAGRKRLASGLGNLGNTCFMNSSIQCLAHTGPLRKYFLSGEYTRDLNRDNPLGTGGELATQFATLLLDMWGVSYKRRNVLGHATGSQYSSDSSLGVVFPRSFKYCLGKHAEQFVGYEQHDSQELATYLLDALHEDTNRVTKKPYIEIPEQAEDESDEIAANKAWKLHLQRENSKVIENFMGQVKSRLECCREGCNRVSTTFDPFMFLSVPIPGSSDKSLKVTFVPLDPNRRMKTMTLTVSKTATIGVLLTKLNEQLVTDGVVDQPIPLEDLCAADVWSNEVFGWYQTSTEIDRIRDTDKTFIYQLRPLSEVREESKSATEEETSAESIFGSTKRSRKYNIDLETLTRLNHDDEWKTELEKYVQTPTLLLTIFNPKRGTVADLLQFHKKLENFIELCHNEIADEETTGKKRTRDGNSSGEKVASDPDFPDMHEKLQGLQERSDSSVSFKGVSTRNDVAILEFCASKVRQYVLNMVNSNKESQLDGVVIQVVMRRNRFNTNYTSFVKPLVMRISSTMTVYNFREVLSSLISRSLKKTRISSSETGNSSFGTPELLAMRQVSLAFDRKGTYGSKSSSSMGCKLGMVARRADGFEDGTPTSHLAVATDESENQLVAALVGQNGTIYVDWHDRLCNSCFDEEEYDAEESSNDADETTSGQAQGEKHITVMDCIEKYCQKEQLDESEMWYCNKCKNHVRAWKQFHLYRTPPILIVHLKRFHFSATTHRRSKITSFIDFPLVGLDLTNLVSTYQEGEEPIYDCYAVSNHYGNLGGGHYTAYTLGDDGAWCHYDDSRVTSDVPPNEVVSEAAYVLYYKRRDVGLDEGPLIDSEVAPIVVDQSEMHRESGYEFSSNDSPHVDGVDDDDDDNMAVDGDGSSRTDSSPISDLGSMEGGHDETKDGNVVCFDPNDAGFALQ